VAGSDRSCERRGGADGLELSMTSSWFGGVALYVALLMVLCKWHL